MRDRLDGVFNMRATIVSSHSDVPADLWDQTFRPPVEGRWWYAAYETAGLGQFDFFYAVLSEDGTPVGLAPVFLMTVPLRLVAPPEFTSLVGILEKWLPALVNRRILFVGSPSSEEGHVGFLPGTDRHAGLAALQTALDLEARRLEASLVVWKDFPAEYDPLFAELRSKTRLFPVVDFPGSEIALPSSSKQDYFAALKGSRRQDLRRRLRRSAEQIDLEVSVVQTPDDAVLDQMFALYQQSYERAAVKFERLNRAFFADLARNPTTYFVLLRERQTSKMVAFSMCFLLNTCVINKCAGLDYTRPSTLFLNYRLWDAVLDWALSVGAKSMRSGQTGYSAKVEFGHHLVPLTNWCHLRNPILHAGLKLIARRISWASLDPDLAAFESRQRVLSTPTSG